MTRAPFLSLLFIVVTHTIALAADPQCANMALADSDCLCGTDPCGVGGFCVNSQCSCGVSGFDVKNQLWKDGATCKCSPTDGELCTTGLYCTINSTCATTPNCSGGSCTTAICGSTLGNTLPLSQNFCAFQNQTCVVQADQSRKCVDASAVTAVASTVVSTAISTAVSTAISTAVATTVSTAVSSAVSSTVSSTFSIAASTAASIASSSASTTKIASAAAATSSLVTTSISSFNVALSSATSSNVTPSSATESPATTNFTIIKYSETSTVAKASPTSNSNSMLGTSTSPVVIQSISSATGTRTVVASSTPPLPSSTTLSPPPLPVDPPGAQNTPLTGSVKVATVNKFITILGHTFPLLNAKSIADTVKTATVFVGTNSSPQKRQYPTWNICHFDADVEGRKRDLLSSRSSGTSGAVMFKGHTFPARRRSVNGRDVLNNIPTCQIFDKTVTSVTITSFGSEGPTFGFNYTDITKFRHFYAQWLLDPSTQSVVGMFVANGYPLFNCSFPVESALFSNPTNKVKLEITHAYSNNASPVDTNKLLDLVNAEVQQLPVCSQKCLPEWSVGLLSSISLNTMCDAWTDRAKTLVDCVNSKCTNSQNIRSVYSVMGLLDDQCSTLTNQIFGLSYSLNADASKIVLDNPDNVIVAGPGAVSTSAGVTASAVAVTTSAVVTTDKAFAASDITSTSSFTTVSPNLVKTMAIPSYGINPSDKQESNQINIPVPTKTPAVGGGKTNVLASSSMNVIPAFCLSLLILFV
ncbi:hypothetical protein HDU79_004431 [Rhizoclosmatium sp. JEL0117]|nr:hypothetical protein HDU79_004431 [Rhizoclosmatium sp. JEL0117]